VSIVQVFERGAHRVVEVRLRGGLVVAIGVLEVDLLQVHRLPVARALHSFTFQLN